MKLHIAVVIVGTFINLSLAETQQPSHADGNNPTTANPATNSNQSLKDRISRVMSNCNVARTGTGGGAVSGGTTGGGEVPPASPGSAGGSTSPTQATESTGSSSTGSSGGSNGTVDGASIFQSKCLPCHTTGNGTKDMASKSKQKKLDMLDSMAKKANLTSAEKTALETYLRGLAQ